MSHHDNLPRGFSIRRAFLQGHETGVDFAVERNGQSIAVHLSEPQALAIALAILGISIEIREQVRFRPRVIDGGRGLANVQRRDSTVKPAGGHC
jgi:hypothetical protein